MQYSVRSRRRLRPTTGEVTRSSARATAAGISAHAAEIPAHATADPPSPPAVMPEGSGAHAMPRPPLPRMLVERVSARAKLSGRDR